IKNHPAYQTWKLDDAQPGVLPVTAKREGDVVGEHRVFYTSSVDQIEISHRAFSREGFVLGAIQAAEWLPGKKGIFTMNDMLNL
ncbi:MAG: dihydrodipicolinate reductase C-terminal domain-containing protein, partial [Bacteroidota bacterium]